MVRNTSSLGSHPLMSRADYVGALRADLPEGVFARAPSRALWLPLHLAVIAAAMTAIATAAVPWFVMPLLSVVIGCSFAGMMFVAHETLHGAVVQNKKLAYLIGWIGFMPLMVAPRLWTIWHNAVHHARTNMPGDPDAYPTIEQYRQDGAARFTVDHFSPGGRRLRGFLSLGFGFTGQSLGQLLSARRQGYFTARQQARAWAETSVGVAVWAVIAYLVGFPAFLLVFLLPLVVANACVMMFILTNHTLSPLTAINDPLVNGLSVTTPRLVDFVTLGFGYHVEHHVFPAMSTRHAPAVRDALKARWPERYQSMPLSEALVRLHRTARVYQTPTTLFDPKTGAVHTTLMPYTH